ncbi:hypothetical protein K461DRAFT_89852 [Myriangium duriaei CBS 260.36]|uniref:Uncharacterized protein n=1 Tax=Myriangium duriaei CBS 260.36 TaxID=1168546 RepID=A0A9P4J9V1_9PEZI|nr:hypothetical protein K461DRAFT_89852 [Myriangium duriaei CBS 260.36]
MVQNIQVEDSGKLYFLYHDQKRSLTEAEYFMMLECGISLVAVNLPSLWTLLTNFAENLRGLRSIASLSSLRSNGSREAKSTRSLRWPCGP